MHGRKTLALSSTGILLSWLADSSSALDSQCCSTEWWLVAGKSMSSFFTLYSMHCQLLALLLDFWPFGMLMSWWLQRSPISTLFTHGWDLQQWGSSLYSSSLDSSVSWFCCVVRGQRQLAEHPWYQLMPPLESSPLLWLAPRLVLGWPKKPSLNSGHLRIHIGVLPNLSLSMSWASQLLPRPYLWSLHWAFHPLERCRWEWPITLTSKPSRIQNQINIIVLYTYLPFSPTLFFRDYYSLYILSFTLIEIRYFILSFLVKFCMVALYFQNYFQNTITVHNFTNREYLVEH